MLTIPVTNALSQLFVDTLITSPSNGQLLSYNGTKWVNAAAVYGNLTGAVTSVGLATSLGSFTSAQLATALTDETGTGANVFANGPTLIAPALGTPASGVATNLTGTASGLTAGNVTTNANLTGPITSIGNATSVASQTGTGSTFVMQASPTLTTPNIGTPSAGVLTNCTGTASGLTAGAATILSTGRTIAITGDLTYTSPAFDGSGNVTAAGTLATVASAGTTGSSTAIPVVTINAKGLTTSITTAVVIAPAGTLTGATLAANVLASSLTSVGTLTGGATGAGFTLALSVSTLTGTLPSAQMPALTGDVTTVSGAVATTLATVNSNVGSFTNSSITVDAKGRITAASSGSGSTGTVTSIATSAGVTGGTITTTGTLSLDLNYVVARTPSARSSGALPYWSITAPSDTLQTASANRIGVSFVGNTVQHATGGITTQVDYSLGAMTHTAVGSSAITNLISVDIPAPIASTNVTATNNYSLRLGGNLQLSSNSGHLDFLTAAGSSGVGMISASVQSGQYGLSFGGNSGLLYVVFNGTKNFLFQSATMYLGGNNALTWSATGSDADNGAGGGFAQDATNIMKVTKSSGGYGWLVSSGTQRVPTDVTNATATPATITGASFTAIAGRKYVGYFLVFANNSVAAEGLAFNFAGTATITDIKFGFTGTPVGTTVGTPYSNAAATPITVTTATTGDIPYMIAFEFVCNAAGTVLMQGAEVSHVTGTATFRAGSFFSINDSPT